MLISVKFQASTYQDKIVDSANTGLQRNILAYHTQCILPISFFDSAKLEHAETETRNRLKIWK